MAQGFAIGSEKKYIEVELGSDDSLLRTRDAHYHENQSRIQCHIGIVIWSVDYAGNGSMEIFE